MSAANIQALSGDLIVIDEMMKSFLYGDRRRSFLVRLMDTDWPQASDIRRMLARYVGMAITKDGEPLVLHAIDRASNAYEKTLGLKPDPVRLDCFLDSIIETLSQELSGIRVQSGKNVWSPSSGIALNAWQNGKAIDCIHKTIAKPEEPRLIANAIRNYLDCHMPKTLQEYRYG